jgi:putative transposase
MAWEHSPAHWIFQPGLYMVTSGTYQKKHYLNSPEKLELVTDALISCCKEFAWELRAWAVLSNHYHFIASSPPGTFRLPELIRKLHATTARELNRMAGLPGRQVWFQYWESKIDFERSYLTRLHYVHYNPALHGVAPVAENYRWCSAGAFARNADPEIVAMVRSFKVERLSASEGEAGWGIGGSAGGRAD